MLLGKAILLTKVNWLLRGLIALLMGLAVFAGTQQFFHVSLWLSAFIASSVALLTGLFATAEKSVDLFKKALEVRKLLREERDQKSVVTLATPEEIREFGQSRVERILKNRYRKNGHEELVPQQFIFDSREKRTADRPTS